MGPLAGGLGYRKDLVQGTFPLLYPLPLTLLP